MTELIYTAREVCEAWRDRNNEMAQIKGVEIVHSEWAPWNSAKMTAYVQELKALPTRVSPVVKVVGRRTKRDLPAGYAVTLIKTEAAR